jgi:pimeloyl-ACP methyl ester carboxylesterase
MMLRGAWFALAFSLVACGGSAEEPSVVAAANNDTGVTEPMETPDSAPIDPPDTASPAWSPELVDLAHACTDASDDVYRTPSGLPSLALGDVIRCAPEATNDLARTKSLLTGTNVEATTGVRQYRVSFRTQKSNGAATASTARVYVPLTPRTGPLPVVVIGHPSEGLADSCAPSKRDDTLKEIALPFAARGYAVIAPDLAGLGNEGTQAYLDNREQGYALLDGARALRRLLKSGAFSTKIVLAGYSQGGGAVLSAQSLAQSYGAGGEVAVAAAFAAQFPTRLESFGFVDLLKRPDDLTIALGYTKPVVAVLRTYAWFANSGRSAAGGIPFNKRDDLTSSIESLCLIPFGGALQARAPRVRDLIDDELRVGLLACINSVTDSKCIGAARDYHEFLVKNHLAADPKGAPILYVQGMMDTVMPVSEEAACNAAKLRADGANLTVCTDSMATHANVVQRNIAATILRIEAMLAGKPAGDCKDTLPACK